MNNSIKQDNNMNEVEEIIYKIKKLHKKLESKTNKSFQITIQSNQNDFYKIGDFEKRKKYIVYDMKIKELEDNYNSLQELKETLQQYCEVKNIKNLFHLDLENGFITYGKGALTLVGKIKIS